MGLVAKIGVGLMGLGVVGTGVARELLSGSQDLSRKIGCPIELKRVLVRNPSGSRTITLPTALLTTSADDLLDNPEIQIVVEVIGGEVPAKDYIQSALTKGKHVVTANKEVMSKHGPEIIALAGGNQVNLLFEASVGGGIPIVRPLMTDLLANNITSIHAIINGTTNYILTRMAADRIDFRQALKEAQEQGYAEADPSDDVEGTDAVYKLAILATLAFHAQVCAGDVYREGISRLQARDFRYAQELGYAIKLLATAKNENGSIQVRVHPCFVPAEHILAKVDGAFNAVEVEGDLVGRVLFHGRGAGQGPTTSAVMGDLVEIARKLCSGTGPVGAIEVKNPLRIAPMSDLISRYYVRINVSDKPGVLAKIAKILGELKISIASVIQMDSDNSAQTAELVVTTHPSNEASMQESIKRINGLQEVHEVSNMVRIEDWPLN